MHGLLVTPLVGSELCQPELLARRWRVCEFAAGVPVPVAPVNEDAGSEARQDNVRLAGQVGHIQPEPEARTVDDTADQTFRPGILRADPLHPSGPCFLVDDVGHSSQS